MEWVVIECLACPSTGTFFSCVISHENEWVILWSSKGELMQPGDVVFVKDRHIYSGKSGEPLIVFTVSAFNACLWKSLQKTTNCPGESKIRHQQCIRQERCFFPHCPYGLKKIKSSEWWWTGATSLVLCSSSLEKMHCQWEWLCHWVSRYVLNAPFLQHLTGIGQAGGYPQYPIHLYETWLFGFGISRVVDPSVHSGTKSHDTHDLAAITRDGTFQSKESDRAVKKLIETLVVLTRRVPATWISEWYAPVQLKVGFW